MKSLFISDLHLDPSRPEATKAFLSLLAGPARSAQRLFILGDLFEAWVGDDLVRAEFEAVMQAMRAYTDAGHDCYFLSGNRDFLIGRDFARATGVVLIEDGTIIDGLGEPAVLMHGDTLCTDDVAYQRLRRVVRNRLVQRLFLSLPRNLRQRLATSLRSRSESSVQNKAAMVMDVNPVAVVNAMREFGVKLLIHGHTHRPGIHTLEVDREPACRIVLGDWYEQTSVLTWTQSGPELSGERYA